jgi:PKD repeat protein
MFVMKKIFTLLLIACTAIGFSAQAQGTLTCNADFNAQYINSNTVKFVPVMTGDSINTTHLWSFGDGNYTLFTVSPTNVYLAPGTYNVGHSIHRYVNGISCNDTITKVVIIQSVPCNLQAYFTWTRDSLSWNTIHFQNQSQPYEIGDSIRWTFGDGSAPINGLVGSLSTPTHVYANAGSYNVCIRVKKNNTTGTAPCVSEICKTVLVTAPPPVCNLQAYFTWYTDSINFNTVHFQNQSQTYQATDSIRWTFGDGSPAINGLVGSLSTPTHVYANAGTYNVCIRVKRSANATGTAPCVSEICKTVVVTPVCNLVVGFNWTSSTTNPLTLDFTNLSTPLAATDSVRWTFGDGTASFAVNPTHTYANAGTYTVCLRVIKNGTVAGTVPCVREFCKTVVVQSLCNIPVSFTMHRDSLNPRKVYFNNTTLTTTTVATVKWNFGDGTSATTWNAVHEYAQPGTYRVCLIVKFAPNCVRESCDTVVIPNPPPACTELSKFNYEKFSNDNQKYKFTPVYIANDIVYTWTFGDGTGSHDPIAVHRYAQPGVYTACLTAWRVPNCASTTCKEIRVVPQVNCDSIHVSYTFQRDPLVPNKLYFYANANFPILDQTWTITRPGVTPVILHQNNPVYVFHDTGYYNVCLKAVMLGGCVKEYCHAIRIENVISSVCELQAYPNPATNVVSVNVALTQPGTIDTYIYNVTNMLVKEKHQPGVTGNNLVSVNINDLVAGLYTIKVMYGGKVCYARFTKL